jgi:hypothetical protein
MINKIVTFYAKELPNVEQVIGYQKKVFNHFGLDIEQVEFTDKLRHPHSEAMTDYLKTITNWDTISIFDIDCVPTSTDTIIDALEIIRDGNTIYGNAQSTKNSTPFAAPNFLNFSHDVWDKTVDIWEKNPYIKRDIFRYQVVTNEDGSETMMDVAERFNVEHRKAGTKVVLSYPIKNEGNPEWSFDGNDEFPKFEWGNGTWFNSKTFHGSEIRYPHKQQVFFDICQKIIS